MSQYIVANAFSIEDRGCGLKQVVAGDRRGTKLINMEGKLLA